LKRFDGLGTSLRSTILTQKRPNGSSANSGVGAATLNETLLDTDVVSDFLNRHSLAEAYEELLIGYAPMISFITVAEMYRGAYKKNWGERRMAELGTHLHQFAVVPSSFEVCLSYAQISKQSGGARTADRHCGRTHRRVRTLVRHTPGH